EGTGLQDFWRQLPDRPEATNPPSACVRSLGALAVTEAQLKAVRLPVAVVVGERDPVKRLYVDPLQMVRPDWPVKVIPGAGHLSCVLQPQFTAELKNWLDQHRGAD